MDPTTNFLTAPTPAARAGELPSPGAGTDSSPQSSEFAGVFNGHMLKLERQALASAAPPAVQTLPSAMRCVQVLRLMWANRRLKKSKTVDSAASEVCGKTTLLGPTPRRAAGAWLIGACRPGPRPRGRA